MSHTVILFNENYYARQIREGYERATKGGKEWVEGSLQMAEALHKGRERVPANISFRDWLTQNKLEFFSHRDRAALINLADNMELARTILTETDSRSYELIWARNKKRYPVLRSDRKTTKRDPRKGTMGKKRAEIFRELKLGEEALTKIKGTSLDTAEEMDELIMLNRGASAGEYTPVVKQLIEDAAAGKDVSAIAVTAKLMKREPPKLVDHWRIRMVRSWQQADRAARLEFLKYLMQQVGEIERNELKSVEENNG